VIHYLVLGYKTRGVSQAPAPFFRQKMWNAKKKKEKAFGSKSKKIASAIERKISFPQQRTLLVISQLMTGR
jgi:hypothetical protein